ncbi:MAG: glycosyltransferase family A protein [Candidatus Doudnabacteria bacterium]|nr:glycosyltransferase family A protein [Candidatus Doudnabacteria bacterium]
MIESGRMNNYSNILKYINNSLLGEDGSLIEEKMHPACKVGVVIQAYDEPPDILLMPLCSLSQQEGVKPEEFEAVVIINNSKTEAANRTREYLANQLNIAILRFMAGKGPQPGNLPAENIEKIKEIKKSGIRVRLIDKSSLPFADRDNFLAKARNRAGAEIAKRFLRLPVGEKGIVAFTDCDCWFSNNYISKIIESFDLYDINGLAGKLELKIDPSIPYADLVEKAVNIHMGIEVDPVFQKIQDGASGQLLYFQKEDKLPYQMLTTGQNIIVLVRSLALVGGVPIVHSASDVHFGRAITNLPGDTLLNTGFRVYSYTRVSERAGLASFGRRVKKISDSITKYMEGKSDKIFVPDRKAGKIFYYLIFTASKEGDLSPEYLKVAMEELGFKKNTLSKKELQSICLVIDKEWKKPASERTFKDVEICLLDKLYPYFPEKDVTELVMQAR